LECGGLSDWTSYSGIKSIPESYFEAAQLDGATFPEVVRYITLPLLRNVTKTCIILGFIGWLFKRGKYAE